MRPTGRWSVAIGALALISAVLESPEVPAATGVQIGQAALNFDVERLGGGTLALSDYAGQPLVIHFFASWLGVSCWREMVYLDAAAGKFQEQGLRVIGVAVMDSPPDIANMVSQRNLTFPIGFDPEARVTRLLYGIGKIPTTLFVDRQGVVREIWVGPIDWATLNGRIAETL